MVTMERVELTQTRTESSLLLGALLMAPIILLGIQYRQSLVYMATIWVTDESYSHGLFIPLISMWLCWKKRNTLTALLGKGSWWSVPLLLLGMMLSIIGDLATLYVVTLGSLWLVVVSLVLAIFGFAGVRTLAFPLGYLLLMIPLPQFLFQELSQQLQLFSSTFGVQLLHAVGITAFREGNVIDLGPIQLQVAEACSGLRYLFPLTALALLCAYMLQAAWWKRCLLFLSSFPIAILVNAFRVGLIGIVVEWQGKSAAEGFYHAFEGWALFLVSLGLVLVEMWALARYSSSTPSEVVKQDPELGPTQANPEGGGKKGTP